MFLRILLHFQELLVLILTSWKDFHHINVQRKKLSPTCMTFCITNRVSGDLWHF